MDIFYKRTIDNLEVLAPFVIRLTYTDGYAKIHSNTVWSIHKDAGATTGMIHLFQDGAGGSIGYFGHWVSPTTPIKLGGVSKTNINDVLTWFIANVAE